MADVEGIMSKNSSAIRRERWDRHEKPPFTPGPWYWNGIATIWNTFGYGEVDREVIVAQAVCDWGDNRHVARGEELDANCLLIAAAPTLHDALDAAPAIRPGETFEQFGERYSRWHREYRVPALAKAAGVSP